MKRSEETVNDPQKKATEASVEVSADRGGLAIGGGVSGGTFQSVCVKIADGKIPPELQECLGQKKGMNIPYPPNANFTGRDTMLANLQAALQSGNNVALTHTKALTGLGGIGKIQLALEYSYRYQDDYDIVWWLRSELPSTLLDDYALMAERLKLPGWDTSDLNLMAVSARSFLEAHSRWLLVFDNARKPQEIEPHLPRSSRGQVIITSRNPIWGNLARAMMVHKFERSESVEFILKRTGQDDRKAADELAPALGDLPLALEQAVAYIETTAKPLDEYLRAYQERRLEVLAKGVPSDYYPETVATHLGHVVRGGSRGVFGRQRAATTVFVSSTR